MDTTTGKQLWDYSYEARQVGRYALENGPGPHTTPAVAAGRVLLPGSRRLLLLVHSIAATSSPLLYRNLVILSGPAKAFIAFRQNDGSVSWHGGAGETNRSSALLIYVGAMEQLVMFLSNAIAEFNPLNGDEQWREPHKTTYGLNVGMPVNGADGILAMSSAYSGGAQGVQLTWIERRFWSGTDYSG